VCVCVCVYRVIKKSLCTWRLQSPHNWWVEDGHHRIHSECGPCYIEHGLQEHSLARQCMSGDWWGTLNITCNFLYCIIRCTETFWSLCIYTRIRTHTHTHTHTYHIIYILYIYTHIHTYYIIIVLLMIMKNEQLILILSLCKLVMNCTRVSYTHVLDEIIFML